MRSEIPPEALGIKIPGVPAALIAQHPLPERDASRLMVLDRARGNIAHAAFRDISRFLRPGDLLVLNDTRVRPVRILGRRATGGKIQALLVSPAGEGVWVSFIQSRGRLREGEILLFEDRIEATMAGRTPEGMFLLRFGRDGASDIMAAGRAPLPPYIRRSEDDPYRAEDLDRYQTVFAREPGAIAAPTAGLHFTPALLKALRGDGIRIATVTLHVGLGTFQPLMENHLREGRLHREWYRCPPETLREVREARSEGRRVIAVGTTSCRVLETVFGAREPVIEGWTDIFIRPPHQFRAVDALLTNFHLPGTSLVLLVAAFAGITLTETAYGEAVRLSYRFYSYGDAMFIG
ncbi:MAG: tRNA preQ1(34) S-adenosylmethionine ribosyltransferase-isomerase QueA [Planctomycetota bacterium]